jgi:hypothetical protein
MIERGTRIIQQVPPSLKLVKLQFKIPGAELRLELYLNMIWVINIHGSN